MYITADQCEGHEGKTGGPAGQTYGFLYRLAWPADIITKPIFAETANGSATTEITFTELGEYQLQVRTFDDGKSTYKFVTVNVQ